MFKESEGTHRTLLLMLLLLPIFRQLGCVNHAPIHCVLTLACTHTHAQAHKSEQKSKHLSHRGPETTEHLHITLPNPDRATTLPFPVYTCEPGLQLCSCVCAGVSVRETVRVFKMPCLWAQYVTLIINYNSFLTSTSSHSNFRLFQCTPSFIHCKLYENISP